MASPALPALLVLVATAVGVAAFVADGAAPYGRPKPRETLSVAMADVADGVTPQQVHISMVGMERIRVTWITEDEAPATVDYGTEPGRYNWSITGSTKSYSYIFYKSGNIHEAVIGPLAQGAGYYYRCGGNPAREFFFRMPPAELPIKFAVVGDLGQTDWTKSTLDHISKSSYDIFLLPGDLSYADFQQPLWDSFGRLVEPLSSARPWMVTQGNHEIEKIPLIHPTPFEPYNARWHMPFEESSSPSNLFYSFSAASGAVHVLMLGSYADFAHGSDQYQWLQADLAKVDRARTPWLLAVVHAPWYNSNKAHRGEGEAMRQALEEMLHAARVDAVFAGHVHAYERFGRVFDNQGDECGAVHITIGDGGNREGLASEFAEPQPSVSLFREASFGHGRFDVVNATHALWTWHRNDDEEDVVADSAWIHSLAANQRCTKN